MAILHLSDYLLDLIVMTILICTNSKIAVFCKSFTAKHLNCSIADQLIIITRAAIGSRKGWCTESNFKDFYACLQENKL